MHCLRDAAKIRSHKIIHPSNEYATCNLVFKYIITLLAIKCLLDVTKVTS